MAVRQRSSGWMADFTFKGERHREQFKAEAAAVAWEAAARAALEAGKPLPAVSSGGTAYETLEGLCQAVEKSVWRTAAATREGATAPQVSNARHFVRFVGPQVRPAAAFTQVQIDEFVSYLAEERQASGSTINRYMAAISTLQKRAFAVGAVDRLLSLPRQQEGEARFRWLTEGEVAAVEQVFRHWGRNDAADFFLVLVDTGARPYAELKKLRWRDVSASPRMVTFWDTKNGDSRSVPLTRRAHEAIERQRALAGPGPFTWVTHDTARALFERLRVALPDLRDATWYTCRHTFASWLVQRGVDLARVQKLMGHRNIQMTMRYAKLAPKHLAEAIAVLEAPVPVAVQAAPQMPAGVPQVSPEMLAQVIALMAQINATASKS